MRPATLIHSNEGGCLERIRVTEDTRHAVVTGVEAAPAAFGQLVEDALAHLSDPVHLQTHLLGRLVRQEQGGVNERARVGQALRQTLLQAVEQLRPSPTSTPGGRSGRGYRLMQLRYVDALEPRAVQEHLGLAKSQYYVEHRLAIDAVVSLLWEQWQHATGPTCPPPLAGRSGRLHDRWGMAAPVREGSLAGLAARLPRPLTSFIGRQREFQALLRLLTGAEAVRLVTLTGPGGIGKTRLAVEVAAAVLQVGAADVRFLELAGIHDPDLVLPCIARAVGIEDPEQAALLEAIPQALGDQPLLLVLDNCEQVVAAAPTLSALVRASPHLQVLATSRRPLGVYGERTFPVPPLELPDPRNLPPLAQLGPYEAMRLFVERAQAVKPDFALTLANAPAIAEICARLEGLPLAIELAAARARLLEPQGLLERLGSRLAVLTGGPRDLPERQRTLRACINWSYDLLDLEEQVLLRRLGVFAGGCRLEAVELIALGQESDGSGLDRLAALVDHGLLRRETDADGAERFVLLETIREYALERLEGSGEAETIRRRHAAFFLDLAERAEPELRGPQQIGWLELLENSHDNLCAALGWMLDHGELEVGFRMAGALWRFWSIHGHLREGRGWLTRLLALPYPPSVLPLASAAKARVLLGGACLARQQNDFGAAHLLHQESLSLARMLGDRRLLAETLFEQGVTTFYQAELPASRQMFEESLALAREQGDRYTVAGCLFRLANLQHLAGRYAAARELHEEARGLFEELGDIRALADCLFNLGYVATDHGDVAAARGYLVASLDLMRKLGDRRGLAWVLEGFAGLAAGIEPERAVRLTAAAAVLRDLVGAPIPPAAHVHFERALEPARRALSGERWAALWEEGRALPLDQALTHALDTRIT